MGMDVASAAFWKQMYNAGKIGAEAFSLCFSRKDEAARTGTEAGAMSLGGTDERLHNTPMVYSATQQSSGFYVVHVRKVWLREGGGGTSAVSTDPSLAVTQLDISEALLNQGRVIVDSGTTDSYFSRKLAGPFEEAWQELMGEPYSHSVKKFTPEELNQQPTILFQLQGDEEWNQAVLDAHGVGGTVAGLAGTIDPDHPLDVILAIPPQHYYEYDDDVNGYVSRFYVDEGSGGVIGANSMMGHDVYFDVTSFRIGWAESSCDYTALVSDYTEGDWTPEILPPDDVSPGRIEPADHPPPLPEDKGDEPNDEPSGNYDGPGAPFCSSFTCQVGVLVGVVCSITFLAVKLIRRAPGGPAYEVADSELELQPPSSFVDRDLEYRDPDEAGEFT